MKAVYSNKFLSFTFFLMSFLNFKGLSQVTNTFNNYIDHLLIAVDNLDNPKREYEKYGFTVVYGGSKEKAINALIFLTDGTLIELIGKDRIPKYWTFLNHAGITKIFGLMKDRISMFGNVQSGLFNYCIYTSDIKANLRYLKSANIRCGKIVSLSRKREDNVKIKWQLIGTYPYDLPFYINDYQPSRLSDSSLTIHANGVVAIDTLFIETIDFVKYRQIYNQLYNQKPEMVKNANSLMAYYKVGQHTIVLISTNNKVCAFRKTGGSIPVSVTLKANKTPLGKYLMMNGFIKINSN